MSDGAIDNLSDIKVSKVTLGFLASLVGLAGFITWNASSIANRISELEETVLEIEQNDNGSDAVIVARLDNLETQISNIGPIDTEDLEEDILDLEELIEELQERIENDVSYQLGDLWWRTDVLIDVVSSRPWGEDLLRQHFSPNTGPPGW
jgi:hypothetical protein